MLCFLERTPPPPPHPPIACQREENEGEEKWFVRLQSARDEPASGAQSIVWAPNDTDLICLSKYAKAKQTTSKLGFNYATSQKHRGDMLQENLFPLCAPLANQKTEWLSPGFLRSRTPGSSTNTVQILQQLHARASRLQRVVPSEML